MDKDFAPDRIEGYPPFISRVPNAGLNWWNPDRSGDPVADYVAGQAHLSAAIDLLGALRDPAAVSFYTALVGPSVSYPTVVLAHIVGSIREIAPMERGFVEALAAKAKAGRGAPFTNPEDDNLSDAFRCGEAHAHACLALARIWEMPCLISDDLLGIVVDQTYEGDFAIAFIWTVCVAAAAGALN